MKMPFQYPFLYCQYNTRGIEVVVFAHLCKKEGKNQESIQSSTTPHPGYQWESDNVTIRHQKRALSQQVITRHQQTNVHESITKQDRNNINDLQKKRRLGKCALKLNKQTLN